jgi:hypothetical protein
MLWPLFFIFIQLGFANQTSLTPTGKSLYWPVNEVPVVIRTNTTDLNSSTIRSIVNNSIGEWNSIGSFSISPVSSSNNEIKFLSDFSIYGSAVVGVTELSYNTSGAINKAVILLNDSYRFTSDQSSFGNGSIYLGDVVTHELGHFVGLSHSEVLDSSMFYSSFPGQSTISADDKAGFIQKYGPAIGSIKGYIKGGNHIGVLGVHVQAISRNTGDAIGAITDENGYFIFKGLNLNDSYYIFTAPIKNPDSLPGFFANVQTEFCPGAYVGSFFSACGRENEGFPQAITLTEDNESVDVGVITINCGLKVNEEYSYRKLQSSFDPLTIWSAEETDISEKAFVGFFSKLTSTTWSAWESLRVDLTDLSAFSGGSLRINFVSFPFGTQLEYEMKVFKNGTLVTASTISSSPVTGTYNTNMSSEPILSSNTSLNTYEIQIRARKISNSVLALTFPTPELFSSDSHLPYLIILGLRQNAEPLLNDQSFVSDNESCLDAPFTFQVKNAEIASTEEESASSSPAGASCGNIEPPNGGNSGGPIFLIVLGFFAAQVCWSLSKKTKNFLS